MLAIQELKDIIKESSTYGEVLRKLNYKTTYIKLQKKILQNDIDAKHLTRGAPYTKQQFEELVRSSHSLAEIVGKLGRPRSYNNLVLFDIRRWELDVSHFTRRLRWRRLYKTRRHIDKSDSVRFNSSKKAIIYRRIEIAVMRTMRTR